MRTAKDIMSKQVITVHPETTISELAKILTTNNINGAPVVDSTGKIVGIVTENDLVFQKKKVHLPTMLTVLDAFFFMESPENLKNEMLKISGSTVADIYTQPAITITEDTQLEEIATTMSEQNIHTLPVMHGSTIVGIIGKRDIIKTLITS